MIPTGVTRPSMAALIKYFLYLGSAGFGGPVALIGYMQRDLVERRGWFTKAEYLKSLALSQLMPGPLAAQVAICLGYVHSESRRSYPCQRSVKAIETELVASLEFEREDTGLEVAAPDVGEA